MIRPRSGLLPAPWPWTLLAAVFLAAPLSVRAQQVAISPHGTLPEELDCSACHTAEGWTTLRDPLGFQHGAGSGFLISEAHSQAACAGCHLNLHFDGPDVAMSDCSSCHADIHQGSMVQDCTACHTGTSFRDVDGDLIHARTSFPLTDAHRQITCESCHITDEGGAYSPRETDCASCHLAAYQGATSLDHVAGGYPTDCAQCHSTLSWADVPNFDHEGISGGFALLGAHDGLSCESCHALPSTAPLFPASSQNDCVACHRADYDHEHGGSNFPTTCLSCHTVDSWDHADFDHALTGFALQESHADLQCATCHGPPDYLSGQFQGAESCISCHQADYDEEHLGSNFSTDCLSCHSQASWEGASVDHAQVGNGFLLSGPHAAATCAACHTVPDYGLKFTQPTTQDDCVACHQAEYDTHHGETTFPTTCLSCHAEDNWEGAIFDHAENTGYPLVGSHAEALCTSCHTVPGYGLTFPKPASLEDCAACHQTDYDDNHAGSGFPIYCLDCHGQTTWEGAVFDHDVSTGFALDGPHLPLACNTCHAMPGFTLLFPKPANPDDCVACHQGDFDSNHGGSSFPVTCLTCHARDTWSGATVDHVTIGNGFALLGAHSGTPCGSCHLIPSFTLLFPEPSGENDCVACHQAQYVSAHTGSGYPTDCAACHTVNAWEPSIFDHDPQYFPIYSGAHREEWNSCNQCHPSPANLAVFTCLTCHEHDQTSMDDKHKEEVDYLYVSSSCLSCHPTGKSDG
jgi:hypothetical protein